MKIDIARKVRSVSGIEGVKFAVDEANLSMVLEKLYDYSDPIGSIVREVTSNAVDAHDEARIIRDYSVEDLMEMGIFEEIKNRALKEGEEEKEAVDGWMTGIAEAKMTFATWKQRNVSVRLETRRASIFDNEQHLFVVQDWGTGLSPIRVYDIYAKPLSSTKRKTSLQMGAFGLGAKSPLGYGSSSFTLKTIFDGVEYHYIIMMNAEGQAVIDPVFEEPTEAENGTTVEIPIMELDLQNFTNAVSKQLAYFDGVETEGFGMTAGSIYGGRTFLFKQNNAVRQMHLALGRAYYPLDIAQIYPYETQSEKWRVPIALRIPMDLVSKDEEEGKVTILWNREALQYNRETIATIKNLIEKAIEEIRELWTANQTPITSMDEFWKGNERKNFNLVISFGDGLSITIPSIEGLLEEHQKERWNYPKYSHFKKLPKDPWINWYHVRDLSHDGKIKTLGRNRVSRMKTLIKNRGADGLLYVYDTRASSSMVKNRYIHSKARDYGRPGDVAFIRRAMPGDDEYTLSAALARGEFGCGANPTDEEIALVREFMREVDEYIWSITEDYRTMEVPEYFLWILAEEKKAAKEQKKIKLGRGDHEIPIKRFVSTDMSNPWRMQDLTTGNAENSTCLTIYGGREDRNNLIQVATILTNIPHFSKTLSNEGPFPTEDYDYSINKWIKLQERVRVLMISTQNFRFFDDNPYAMHVSSFAQDPHRVIKRHVTALTMKGRIDPAFINLIQPVIKEAAPRLYAVAFEVKSYLEANQSSPVTYLSSSLSLMENELISFYSALDKERRDRNRKMKKKGLRVLPLKPIYDESILDPYKTLIRFMAQFPLLTRLDLTKTSAQEVKEYLRLKATINPDLLARKMAAN